MNGYPSNCNACGLYQTSKYYKAKDFCYTHPESSGKSLLIISHYPPKDEYWYPPKEEYNNLLFAVLEKIRVPFYITSTLLCQPNFDILNGKKGKELAKVWYNNCGGWLHQLISTFDDSNLGCIICLGEQAKDQILPGNSLTVDSAKKGIWEYTSITGHKFPVIITNHPSLHYKDYSDGGKDLRKEYSTTFTLAQSICRGEYKKHKFNPILIPMETESDWYMIDQFLLKGTNYLNAGAVEVIFDVEQALSEKDPTKLSVLHPNSKMLCFTLTWSVEGEEAAGPTVVVVRTRNLSKPFIFKMLCFLLAGKVPVGSNIGFDFLATISQYEYTDRTLCMTKEVFPLVEAGMYFFSLLKGWHDIWLYAFVWDQGAIDIGAKSLTYKLFKEPDYGLYIKNLYMQAKQKNPLATYEDIPYSEEKGMWEVEWYCGLDGFWEWNIRQFQKKELADPNCIVHIPYNFKLEEIQAACLMTLEGVQVDRDYFESSSNMMINMISQMNDWIQAHPYVVQLQIQDPKADTSKLSNSSKQLTTIINNILPLYPGLETKLDKTASGAWWSTSEDSDNMKILCELTGEISDFFKVLQQMRKYKHCCSTFLQMPQYYALYWEGYGWRVHPTWRIAASDFNQGNTSDNTEKKEGTDSSRWASEPNMQNIPNRIAQEIVALIRRGYIPNVCNKM